MSAETEYVLAGWSAKRLDCTPDGVRYLARTGRLPVAMVVSGIRLFRRADVEQLRLERQERRRTEPTPADAT
jgi:DNA-binding transcriptional MerR regulator